MTLLLKGIEVDSCFTAILDCNRQVPNPPTGGMIHSVGNRGLLVNFLKSKFWVCNALVNASLNSFACERSLTQTGQNSIALANVGFRTRFGFDWRHARSQRVCLLIASISEAQAAGWL